MADDPRAWWRIVDKADPKTKTAEVHIYDEIGGIFGQPAAGFVRELKAVKADEIQLHVNSPGGEVFDSIAIMNTLRNHPARVVATVDGVAASSASFVVQAADEIVMARNSEMMIHDAAGLAVGNVTVMRELADRLDAASNNIASIYAERAGGTVEDWRTLMQAETWFSAQETVDAGLADRVDEAKVADDSVKARFDLSIYNHAGRADAPSPRVPARPKTPVTAMDAARRIHNASIKAASTPKEGDVQFSDEDLATLRTKLGLTDDDTLEPSMVLAAIGGKSTGSQAPPDPDKPADKPRTGTTIVVDAGAWDAQQEAIRRLEANDAKRRANERDQIINQAVTDGKFPPARVEHWQRVWDADPEGTRTLIDGLTRNAVPVVATGYAGGVDDDSVDEEFAYMFPPVPKGA